MWFLEEPSQFSVVQTAHSLTCSIMDKPHTGLDDCLRILLSYFRKRMSSSGPGTGCNWPTPSSPSCWFFTTFWFQVGYCMVVLVYMVVPTATIYRVIHQVREILFLPLNCEWCFSISTPHFNSWFNVNKSFMTWWTTLYTKCNFIIRSGTV